MNKARRGIFISYRRATNGGYAGRIRTHLTERYGAENVFIDVESIRQGTDFVDAIDEALESCRAVLVIIDPNWLSVEDSNGNQRLAKEGDWVRVEIETAIARARQADRKTELAIVPVLVGEADFPSPTSLPESLAPLTRYNGVELRDTHFESDLDDVMGRIGRGWHRVAKLAGIGTFVAVVAVVLGWLAFRNTTPPVDPVDSSAMNGDLNVAVADFTTLQDGKVVADPDFTIDDDVANELFEELGALKEADFTFDVRRPVATGIVRGQTADERAESAAALAELIGADVVIYGFREPTAPQALTPEFFVSDRKLGDALELAGPHAIGARIRDTAEPELASRRNLRRELLARTSSMTDFVVGLVNLGTNKPEDALRWFSSAATAADEWETTANSQVFHLYVGSSLLRLGQLDDARTAFQRAIEIEPAYARALVGLAEIQFQQSQGNCSESAADAAGLTAALQAFDDVLLAPEAPPAAHIDAKVALGRGRVMVCRSQAGFAAEWELGREELIKVIDAYEAGVPVLREFAALAYGTRSLVELRLDLGQPTPDRLRAAIADLEVAYELTRRTDVQNPYAALLGSLYRQLGDASTAETWCELTTLDCASDADIEILEVVAMASWSYGPTTTTTTTTTTTPPTGSMGDSGQDTDEEAAPESSAPPSSSTTLPDDFSPPPPASLPDDSLPPTATLPDDFFAPLPPTK